MDSVEHVGPEDHHPTTSMVTNNGYLVYFMQAPLINSDQGPSV